MVQPANLRDRNDLTFGRRLNATWDRRVAIRRKMTSGIVIVVEVLGQDAVQMPFGEHDDVIRTIAAYAADHSFAIRILPRRPRCDGDFLNPHAFDTLGEVVAVDAVAIAEEKPRCFFVRKGVDDLLGGPYGVGQMTITLDSKRGRNY